MWVQPSYVRDVANALVNTLNSKEPLGQTYQLGGPEVLSCVPTFVQLIRCGLVNAMAPVHSLNARLQAQLVMLLGVVTG